MASARTASIGVEWTRSVMALAANNCTLSSLLVLVADSQVAQATVALMRPDIDWQSFRTCSQKLSCRSYYGHAQNWDCNTYH